MHVPKSATERCLGPEGLPREELPQIASQPRAECDDQCRQSDSAGDDDQGFGTAVSLIWAESEYLLNPIHPNLLFDDLGCSDHFG
jgi:hypothetical protein